MSRPELRDLLIKHEGLRLKPYTDSVGKLTIGVGRNLEDVGLTGLEATYLLANDIQRVCKEVECFDWINDLSVTRQDVVLSMVFNLGLSGFKKFKKLIEALRTGNYEEASRQMLDSLWAKQVGPRAIDLANMMKFDKYL